MRVGRTAVIAHRGASAHRHENTLEAFRLAAGHGADAVELDVRRTADGVLVVHHDPAIPGLGAIVDAGAAELAEAAPWIPSLRAALEACAGMWVNAEIKNSPADPDWDPDDLVAGQLLALLSEGGWAAGTLVSSFNPATIERIHRLEPSIATGWLVDSLEPFGAVATAAAAGHRSVHLHHRMLLPGADREAAAAAARAGVWIIAWTVDDADEARRLASARIHGVITNDPRVIRNAIGPQSEGRLETS